ncbi:Uncharacterized protein HZ326_22675 [Fusarium oxysporum f. sp. albedinis]|nr:Uncharacterized protein HZ326_22675 [Fusarium oxysporum f. sp. albedinis]
MDSISNGGSFNQSQSRKIQFGPDQMPHKIGHNPDLFYTLFTPSRLPYNLLLGFYTYRFLYPSITPSCQKLLFSYIHNASNAKLNEGCIRGRSTK